MHISLFKKIISYLYPVKIRRSSSIENPLLELFLYKGEWQLATKDALYSDGSRYRPLVEAFGRIKQHLPGLNNVLVMGVGLGSAVAILDKMNAHPLITLVDIDEVVLRWAEELIAPKLAKQVKFICQDAEKFIKETEQQYDVIVVDVFKGRVVPEFVTNVAFLSECKKSLSEKGFFIINYMIVNQEDWNNIQQNFGKVFPESEIINLGMNRILMARA